MTRLLTTGARVNRVNEEGEVNVYCYSLQRSFSFHVGGAEEARRWGSLLGKGITVQILHEEYVKDLYECDACAATPGCPTLCYGCVERRKKAGSAWRGQRPTANEAEALAKQIALAPLYEALRSLVNDCSLSRLYGRDALSDFGAVLAKVQKVKLVIEAGDQTFDFAFTFDEPRAE